MYCLFKNEKCCIIREGDKLKFYSIFNYDVYKKTFENLKNICNMCRITNKTIEDKWIVD